jgi:hypothetical protein
MLNPSNLVVYASLLILSGIQPVQIIISLSIAESSTSFNSLVSMVDPSSFSNV